MGHLLKYNFRKNKGFPKKRVVPGEDTGGAGYIAYQNIMLRKRRGSDLTADPGIFTQGFDSANDIPSITGGQIPPSPPGNWNSTHGYATKFRHVPVPLGIYHSAYGQNVGCLDCLMPGSNSPAGSNAWSRSKGLAQGTGTTFEYDTSGLWNGQSPQYMKFDVESNLGVGDSWPGYGGQYVWRWVPAQSSSFMIDAIEVGYMGQVSFNDGWGGCNANGTDDCTADSWLIKFIVGANTQPYGRCVVTIFGVQEYESGSDANGVNTCVVVGLPGWDEGAIWPISIAQGGTAGC